MVERRYIYIYIYSVHRLIRLWITIRQTYLFWQSSSERFLAEIVFEMPCIHVVGGLPLFFLSSGIHYNISYYWSLDSSLIALFSITFKFMIWVNRLRVDVLLGITLCSQNWIRWWCRSVVEECWLITARDLKEIYGNTEILVKIIII